MNRQDKPLPLFLRRTMGEMMGATTDFLRRNRRSWLLYVGVPLLPCCLLLARMKSTNEDMGSFQVIWSALMGFDFHLGEGFFTPETLLFALALTWVLWAVHALLRVGTTPPSAAGEPASPRVMLRLLLPKAAVLFVMTYVAARLLQMDSGMVLLLVVLLLPLSLFPPAWLLHDDGGGTTVVRFFNVLLSQWANLMVVMVVMGFMVFMLRGVVQLPTLLMEVSIETLTRMDERPSDWFLFLQYLATALSWWAFFMGFSILAIQAAFVYGNGVEKVEGDTIVNDIYQFENL